MKVFARESLTPGHLAADDEALLLEGCWPDASHRGHRWSLDESIDGQFDWIDDEAARLADELTETAPDCGSPLDLAGLAWLDALRLRYELVKLLRVAAFFENPPERRQTDRLEVYVERNIDHDYEGLLKQIARTAGWRLTIVELSTERQPLPRFPGTSFARRLLGDWSGRISRATRPEPAADERIVFCGNPRILDPVCREAIARGCRVWWLYERFAVKHFLAWRPAGVEQLVCDSNPARTIAPRGLWPDREIELRGIDLGPALENWSVLQNAEHGAHHAQLFGAVNEHFDTTLPTRLIMDEDASPLQRCAVVAARRHGAPSTVVQHGIPAIRFGYAPLSADQMCVWNAASREQLLRWGVPAERIHVTGSSVISGSEGASSAQRKSNAANVLLLASTPANSRRPDSVRYCLTKASERAMLQAVCRAVERIRGSLQVRLHPRRSDVAALRDLFAQFPMLPATLDRHTDLQSSIAAADCVVSCGSTAGYEALLAGKPVIQMLPPGSGELLPDELWGWVGTARSSDELASLLRRALDNDEPARPIDPLPDCETAARQILEAALSAPRAGDRSRATTSARDS